MTLSGRSSSSSRRFSGRRQSELDVAAGRRGVG